MSDWREVPDKASGKSYYYNKKTKETTWAAPQEYLDYKASQASQPAAEAPASSAEHTEPKSTREEWKEVVDQTTGKVYYYNRKTKQTSWKKPESMGGPDSSAAASASPTVSSEPLDAPVSVREPASSKSVDTSLGDWKEVVDKTSGKTYYYNRKTKVTSWEKPVIAAPAAAAPVAATPAPEAEKPAAAAAAAVVPATPVVDAPAAVKPSPQEMKQASMAASPKSDSKEADSPKRTATLSDSEENYDNAKDDDNEDLSLEDRVLKMKRALHDIDMGDAKKELDKSEELDLRFAKHRHGWLNRFLRQGEALDAQKMMTFKKSMIKKSLLKTNRDMDKEAVQAFKNVMSYMGDRESGKEQILHAFKLLKNGLDAPENLRDEMYIQICKQVTGNPNLTSTIKGWELMTFYLCCFPPSKRLRKFLHGFCSDNEKHNEEKIKKFAKYCGLLIDLIIGMGVRKAVPGRMELQCIQNMSKIAIRVFFVDNSFKTLEVDSFTLVSEVEEMLARKIDLSCMQPFGLFEKGEDEKILEPKDRVLDTLALWEKHEDVDAKSSDAEKKAAANAPEKFKLVYKAKLMLKTNDPELSADPKAIELTYMQAANDVLTHRIPLVDKDLPIIAALQLQATFGDCNEENNGPGILKDKLEQYLPKDIILAKGKPEQARAEWAQKIFAKYSKLTGFDAHDARMNYLDYCQEMPCYGAAFFSVEQRQFKEYPNPIIFAVNCEGISLIHPEKKKTLELYPYSDVVTWGFSDEKLIVVVGNLVQQRKLVFKTNVGKYICSLIRDYVSFKVKNKKA